MLRLRFNGDTFVLGIDAENIRRLMNKQPIAVDLEELGGTGIIVIMAGETLDDVKKDIESMTDTKLPEIKMPGKYI